MRTESRASAGASVSPSMRKSCWQPSAMYYANRKMEMSMRVEQPHLRRSAPLSSQRRSEAEQPLVIIVDDDASVQEALSELILSAGFQHVCFSSTRELLNADVLDSA